MKNGYLRVAAVSPNVALANPAENARTIIAESLRLNDLGVDIALFPEMSICGYSCGDLLHNFTLLEESKRALETIVDATRHLPIDIIVGMPVATTHSLKNCAAVIQQGETKFVDKTYAPCHDGFSERRWFAPTADRMPAPVIMSHGVAISVEIGEDLWAPIPPSAHAALRGAEVIFNLSAADDTVGKYQAIRSAVMQQSARSLCAYVYASSGWGESSTDLTFLPKDIIAESGSILAENDRFDYDAEHHCAIVDIDIAALRRDRLHNTTFSDCAMRETSWVDAYPISLDEEWEHSFTPEYRKINPLPFIPTGPEADTHCDEIMYIQSAGLMRRLKAIGCSTVTVGISGGLDSTLALLVAVEAFDRLKLPRTGIVGVTMPGFGTTGRTYQNALKLMQLLGITIREVSIKEAVLQHFKDIGHDPSVTDVTYENSQARERTQILMDISNQTGGIVLGTGDMSELALGWATYNGDHMSMYGVNAGVAKTLVRVLVKRFAERYDDKQVAEILLDVLDTPISPELIPANDNGEIRQITEDLVGPYQLHDFFLYYTLRFGFSPKRIFMLARKAFAGEYTNEVILHWLRTFLRRFFSQQFKRSCLPDGPKVDCVSLSPRGDWRMPSDATAKAWLNEIDQLSTL